MQVGDRVRCIAQHGVADQFTPGNIYVVRDVSEFSIGVVADDSGHENGWNRNFFELVQDDGREELEIYTVIYTSNLGNRGVYSHVDQENVERFKATVERIGYQVLALKKFKTRI